MARLAPAASLAAEFFHVGAGARDASEFVIFDYATDAPTYDSNRSAGDHAVLFATLAPHLAIRTSIYGGGGRRYWRLNCALSYGTGWKRTPPEAASRHEDEQAYSGPVHLARGRLTLRIEGLGSNAYGSFRRAYGRLC